MCLLIHTTFLCRPSASNCVSLQRSLGAPVAAWDAFESISPLILWKKRRGGKGIEEVFVSCLWFVFSTKNPQSHQSEWFTLLGMNKVSVLLFIFVGNTASPSGYLIYSKIPNPGWNLLFCD